MNLRLVKDRSRFVGHGPVEEAFTGGVDPTGTQIERVAERQVDPGPDVTALASAGRRQLRSRQRRVVVGFGALVGFAVLHWGPA